MGDVVGEAQLKREATVSGIRLNIKTRYTMAFLLKAYPYRIINSAINIIFTLFLPTFRFFPLQQVFLRIHLKQPEADSLSSKVLWSTLFFRSLKASL
jgi:hypothetical protein